MIEYYRIHYFDDWLPDYVKIEDGEITRYVVMGADYRIRYHLWEIGEQKRISKEEFERTVVEIILTKERIYD